ncbi:MAG: GDSL-type esterase/lipase family protein [bacterium]|nr:GDSL-type esterase/lipase family protein [bacterium]
MPRSAQQPGGPTPGHRARTRRSLWLRALVALIALLVATEAVLQIGSVAVWASQSRATTVPPTGEPTILCVGDSWTHGMGSSDPARHSYPAVLEQLLAERVTARSWRVINGGESGQNSRDVLERLPSQLQLFRPQVVCVLVGQNDYWSRPQELPVASQGLEHGEYRFRWRLPRLIAWASATMAGSEEQSASASESNVSEPNTTVPSAGDRDDRARSGPEWQPQTPESIDPYRAQRRPWRLTEAARVHVRDARSCRDRDEVEGAIAHWRAALELVPDAASVRRELAVFARENGMTALVDEQIVALQRAFQNGRDYRVGKQLVMALGACGRDEAALAIAEELLADHPLDAALWCERGRSEFMLGRHPAARRSLTESIRLGAPRWAYLWQFKNHMAGYKDRAAAVRSIFACYVRFNDHGLVSGWLRNVAQHTGAAGLQEIVAAIEPEFCKPAVRARLDALVEDIANDDPTDVIRVFGTHLDRVAAAVRAAGAVPVFLTYPRRTSPAVVLEAVAQARGVDFIKVWEGFGQRLGDRVWNDVRAPDGHCNDDGYRIMAGVIADGLAPILVR